MALVENSSLLVLTSGVVNDSTEGVIEARVPAIVPEATRVEGVVSVLSALRAGQLEVDIRERLYTDSSDTLSKSRDCSRG